MLPILKADTNARWGVELIATAPSNPGTSNHLQGKLVVTEAGRVLSHHVLLL
jgi:hypothetical protein